MNKMILLTLCFCAMLWMAGTEDLYGEEGLISVPNVIGMTREGAEAALTSAGLSWGEVTETYTRDQDVDRVLSQNPAAGLSVISGAPVAVTVLTSLRWRIGDANVDGLINVSDVGEILYLAAGNDPAHPASLLTADVNKDDKITNEDAQRVSYFIRAGGVINQPVQGVIAQSGADDITLVWAPIPLDNVEGYHIERKQDEELRWMPLATSDEPVYYDTSIEAATYHYRVAALDTLGNIEPYSATVTVLGKTIEVRAPVAYGRNNDVVVAPISLGSTRGLQPQSMWITATYDPTVAQFVKVLPTMLTWNLQFFVDAGEAGTIHIYSHDAQGNLSRGAGRFFDIILQMTSDAPERCQPTALTQVTFIDPQGVGIATQSGEGFLCIGEAVWGDLNGDGQVSIEDAMVALDIAVRALDPTSEQLFLGDLNGDQRIDAADAVLILRLARGFSLNPENTATKNKSDKNDAPPVRWLSLPGNIVATVGKTLQMPVTLDNALGLAGMDLIISFPTRELVCTGITPAGATQSFQIKTDIQSGYARIGISDALALGNGEADLVVLHFNVVGEPTTADNPAPIVKINYAEIKGELGDSFRWHTDVERTNSTVVIVEEGSEGEGESNREGEEGAIEGEPVVEGEEEGEVRPEGEGETSTAKEGEDAENEPKDSSGGCAAGCRDKKKGLYAPFEFLDDLLLFVLSAMVLMHMTRR